MVFHHARLRRPDPRQAGKVKFLTIVLLAAVVAGGYFLYVWGPLELDNFDVKKYCEQALNQTWRYKDTDHPRAKFLSLVGRMGTHPEDQGGETVQVPNINPDPEDMTVQIDQSVTPAVISIDARYARTVPLPGLKRDHTFWFTAHCEQTLQGVSWK